MNVQKFLAATTLLSTCVLTVLLTGCTLGTTATSVPDSATGAHIGGSVYGGNQPITSAKVYLLAANPGGYGLASLSLATTALTGNAVDSIGAYTLTGAQGQFSLAGDYSCTTGYALGATTASGGVTLSGSEQIYIYVLGGNTGAGVNTNSGMLAALGPCNAQFSSSLFINEVTTVAAAYAFAGFATDATHVSSSGTALALTGLTNAGLNAANLVNVATGLPITSAFFGIIRPHATIYTLADILAACVNGTTGNAACSTLFQYTESSGATGTAPTDTATAAINLAHNPWPTAAGMDALYGLTTTNPPFSGGLSAEPNDFIVALQYTGGGVANLYAHGIAIDASGNAWVIGESEYTMLEFSSTGQGIGSYSGGGMNYPDGIAIDPFGNVWTANGAIGSNSVSKFSSAGAAISTSTGYTGAGLSYPNAIAIDGSGNVWASNLYGNTVSKLSNTGGAISGTGGYTGGGINNPDGIAIDSFGNAWIANGGTSSLSKISGNNGIVLSPTTGFTGAGLNYPVDVAIDNAGNTWAVDYDNSLSKVSGTGVAISTASGYTGGGLSLPQKIAMDGAGNAWVANYTGKCVAELSSTGTAISPSGGYTGGGFSNPPYGIAVDGSGDVWTANFDNNNSGSLTEFIGAATPVVTPIAANLHTPYSAPASKP